MFWEMELSSSRLKRILIFHEGTFQARKIKKTHSKKISYILGNGTFQPQLKKTLIFFQKKLF